MAALNFHDVFNRDVLEKIHNLSSGGDTIKVALSNVAIATSVTSLAGITEIAAGGGYVAGGFTLSSTTSAPTTGAGAFSLADYTLTPSGTYAAWRYGLIYNVTASNRAIASFDNGSVVNLVNPNTHLLDFSTSALIFNP